jgi:HK97 family phage portal protein
MMGIIAKLIERRDSLENPSTSLYKALTGLDSVPVKSGVKVNEKTALRSAAVFAAVRVITETIASLPLFVYRRLSPKGKEIEREHGLYEKLHDRPNPYMTSFTWRETSIGHLLLWGNAYSEIEYDHFGDIKALWLLLPNRTAPVLDNKTGELRYRTHIKGKDFILRPESVLHIPGLGFDGTQGYSVISHMSESVGLSIAAEQYGASFFRNNSIPGGVIEHPDELTQTAHDRMRNDWERAHRGLDKAHRIAILEEGASWKQIGIPAKDAQMLETRKFQVTDIARIFRVPPHMIGDLEHATFSNIEHQQYNFVVHTIRPWCVRMEQVMNWKLFPEKERKQFFTEYLIQGLLRGDIKSRYEAYSIGRQNGWLNADEIRELENMNPEPEGQGKIYLVPLNMVPAEFVIGGGKQKEPTLDKKSQLQVLIEQRTPNMVKIRRNITNSYKPVFMDVAARIIRRERNDILVAAKKYMEKKDEQQFMTWLTEFYQGHRDFVIKQMSPVYNSVAESMRGAVSQELNVKLEPSPEEEAFIKDYMETFASRHNQSSEGQLRSVVEKAQNEKRDPVEALEERFQEWEEKRPEKITRWESIRSENAFVKQAYVVAGISRIRWVTLGQNCPYCKDLNGKVIGIKGNFIGKGEQFNPGGAAGPLVPSFNVGHPPAHAGCDCSIIFSL